VNGKRPQVSRAAPRLGEHSAALRREFALGGEGAKPK
jgi:hypothetical protein